MRSTKKLACLLMVLALCLSMLSGMTAQAATVNYVTGNSENYSNVIKNWGQRGTTATFLSSNAESFYDNNGVTYAELSAYSGATSVSSVPSSALYRELQELMKDNHKHITTYDRTKQLYRFTDCQNSSDTSISSFYSGTAIGPAWDGGSTWNREHTWPNSKGLAGSDENDIMMLRPTSSRENSARGNTAYGESSSYYDPNDVSGGKYNLHGDVARIMLYVYVRWGNTGNMWGTSGVMESKEVLLKWMEEDPVDTWELGRNDSVESVTGTRNVFVDYPELAFLLFNEEIPTDMTTPSGEAINSGSAYTITAQSSNTAYGTVSLSGRTINASPAKGYAVVGYTLISGTAQVTQVGNSFTVEAQSDCTVRIDFAPRTQVAVSFSQAGSIVSQQVVYSGDSVTLPDHEGNAPEGLNFVGWVTTFVEAATERPDQIYTAGSSYPVGTGCILRALYARQDENATGTSNVFEPYTGELTEGDYLVVYEGGAMQAVSLNNRIGYREVTTTEDNILSPQTDIVWHIAREGDYWTFYNDSESVYAGGTGVRNNAGVLTELTDYAKWSVTGSETYDFVNLGNSNDGVNALLRRNTTYGFACYGENSGLGGPVSLYKRAASGVVYSTADSTSVDVEGDFDGNGVISDRDALYLLRHTLFEDEYPITGDGDVNGDGKVTDRDVAYLLRHVHFGDRYPLYPNKQ